MILALLACADPEFESDPGLHTLARDFAGKVAKSTTLTISVDGDDAASVALVQFTGSAGTYTRHDTLVEKAVSGGVAKVSLDAEPGAGFLSDGGGSSALFVVLLLDSAGVVIGVTDDILGYYKTAPSGASSSGWLVATGGWTGTPSKYAKVSAGIKVEQLFTGDSSVSLRGSMSVESFSSTARMQAAPIDTEAEAPADWAIAKKWEVSLSGTPDEDSVRTDDEFRAAWFPLVAYDDTDRDKDWGASELSIGAVCHGSSDVIVRWVDEEDEDLDAIWSLYDLGVVYGWSVGTLDGTELDVITDASSLKVKDSC